MCTGVNKMNFIAAGVCRASEMITRQDRNGRAEGRTRMMDTRICFPNLILLIFSLLFHDQNAFLAELFLLSKYIPTTLRTLVGDRFSNSWSLKFKVQKNRLTCWKMWMVLKYLSYRPPILLKLHQCSNYYWCSSFLKLQNFFVIVQQIYLYILNKQLFPTKCKLCIQVNLLDHFQKLLRVQA